MKGTPKMMEIKREDLERLLEHARPSLTQPEYEQLKAALDTLVYLTHLLGKKSTTIRRLRALLFGASSEKDGRGAQGAGWGGQGGRSGR